MTRLYNAISISVASILLSGCASGVLRVDQDRYNHGATLQNGTILGPPQGDFFENIVPPAFVTDDTPGDIGRAIRIGDRILFSTVSDHAIPDRYQIVWTGVRSSVGQAVTNIILRDDAGDEALRVRYQLNDIDVIWGDDVGLSPAFHSQAPHEVRIILHMNGASTSADIIITQGSSVIMDRRNLDLIDREFSRLDVVEVRTQTDYHMKDLVAVALDD